MGLGSGERRRRHQCCKPARVTMCEREGGGGTVTTMMTRGWRAYRAIVAIVAICSVFWFSVATTSTAFGGGWGRKEGRCHHHCQKTVMMWERAGGGDDDNDDDKRGERISCRCHRCHRSFRRRCLQSQRCRRLLEGGWGVGRDVVVINNVKLQE